LAGAEDRVRAVFTYYFATADLASRGPVPLGHEPRCSLLEAMGALMLLHQCGAGSIRELAEQYFQSEALHEIAKGMLSPGALIEAQGDLLDVVAPLDRELADGLIDLACLVNPSTGEIDLDLAQRLLRPELRFSRRIDETFSRWEIDYFSRRAIGKRLGPLVQERADLHVPDPRREAGRELWVERRRPESVDGVKVVACDRIAGCLSAFGIVRANPSEHDCDLPVVLDDTVYLFPGHVDMMADLLAFYVASPCASAQLLKWLAKLGLDLDECPNARGDAFRAILRDKVILHEIGHLRTLRVRFAGPDAELDVVPGEEDTLVWELLANAHVFDGLAVQTDPTPRLFLVLELLVSHLGDCTSLLDEADPTLTTRRCERLITLEALVHNAPERLREVVSRVDELRASGQRLRVGPWLGGRAEKARERVLAAFDGEA